MCVPSLSIPYDSPLSLSTLIPTSSVTLSHSFQTQLVCCSLTRVFKSSTKDIVYSIPHSNFKGLIKGGLGSIHVFAKIHARSKNVKDSLITSKENSPPLSCSKVV